MTYEGRDDGKLQKEIVIYTVEKANRKGSEFSFPFQSLHEQGSEPTIWYQNKHFLRHAKKEGGPRT